jgi:hypothetical protein
MSNYKIHRAGKLRGEKITYSDGTGCCIWIPFKEKEGSDEEPGICFDFSASDLSDLKNLVDILITAEPDIYIPDPELEKHEIEWKKKEATLWYKLKNKLDDFSFTFNPFDWNFTALWISRPTDHNGQLCHKICEGFRFGPITITWPRYVTPKKQKRT